MVEGVACSFDAVRVLSMKSVLSLHSHSLPAEGGGPSLMVEGVACSFDAVRVLSMKPVLSLHSHSLPPRGRGTISDGGRSGVQL